MGFVKTKWSHFVDTVDKHLLVHKVTYSSKNHHVPPKNAKNTYKLHSKSLFFWSVFVCKKSLGFADKSCFLQVLYFVFIRKVYILSKI